MKKTLDTKAMLYPAPVVVVGVYDEEGKATGMTVAYAGICCSRPPSIMVSLRKATYTYGCIVDRKVFTLNVPSEEYIKEADYFGIASGRDQNKFEVANLTAKRSEVIDAPYIEEFPLVMSCRLIHILEIGLHTMFVGEILEVRAEEAIIGEGNTIDVEKLKPCMYMTSKRQYYGIGDCLGDAYTIGRK